jgi:hypothetical protein
MRLQFNAQLRKIQQGQWALEAWLDTPIASFISPWNIDDEQTVRVLELVNVRAWFASLGIACKGEATALLFRPLTRALSEFNNEGRTMALVRPVPLR